MEFKPKEQLDFYFEFKDWYFKIINDFNFDYNKDYRAREYLSKVLDLKAKEWHLDEIIFSFQKRIQEKSNIFIYGCGPSLEVTVDYIIENLGMSIFGKSINLAADGAAVFLKEKLIPVDAIFTDLDGITSSEFNYPDFLIIHAHGDNIKKIRSFKQNIIKFQNLIGTTQVEPNKNVINPGGFTDGDRILFFLRTMLAPFNKLYLIGMDFKNIIGKYSKLNIKKDQEGSFIKQKKLRYAVELIKWIRNKIVNEFIFVNSQIRLNNFNNLSVEEFVDNYK
ncbi:hypothetical protein LCGC14_0783720 [marine sediment metagenome]|uniref:6-hydroxymethylpterin diphosphokinase MptE-like domain-containing protein n=1 Tax=marine sediment metagenome TaxID=412755 RepID=A0A0F9PZ00_9ZZZZ